jgi:hypothetical protein
MELHGKYVTDTTGNRLYIVVLSIELTDPTQSPGADDLALNKHNPQFIYITQMHSVS